MHPDGLMIANGQSNGVVCLWDIRSQKCLNNLESHKSKVIDIAFSEKGIYLASCGKGDSNVQIWDLRYLSNGPAFTIETSATK